MAGLYIHVPFCTKRCLYCDFYSNTDMRYKQLYIDTLIQEMQQRASYLDGEMLETIYFGGGTPSQLNASELGDIFEAIYKCFHVADSKEITLEANPDDMNCDYVADLHKLPINRISMGVQSFDDSDLRFLNRRHDSRKARSAVHLLQDSGFENISVDLIYGLPGQTEKKWTEIIKETVKLEIPHISAYHLIYEEGTALFRLLEKGIINQISEDESLSLFSILRHSLMDVGYEHYEISNFARPGYYSKHNSAYWQGKKYLGLGPSAHSFNGKEREWNVSSIDKWIEGIRRGVPAVEYEYLEGDTGYNDYIVTHLRTMWGIDFDELSRKYGKVYLDYCLKMAKKYVSNGSLIQNDKKLLLTEQGIFVSDGIISDLLKV